jgi:hypothetical protein
LDDTVSAKKIPDTTAEEEKGPKVAAVELEALAKPEPAGVAAPTNDIAWRRYPDPVPTSDEAVDTGAPNDRPIKTLAGVAIDDTLRLQSSMFFAAKRPMLAILALLSLHRGPHTYGRGAA